MSPLSATLFPLVFFSFLVLAFSGAVPPAEKIQRCEDPKDLEYPGGPVCRRCELPYDGDYCARRNADSSKAFQNAKKLEFKTFTKAVELQDGDFISSCFAPKDHMNYNSKLQNEIQVDQVDVYVTGDGFEEVCKVYLKPPENRWTECKSNGSRISGQHNILSSGQHNILSFKCKDVSSQVVRIRCRGADSKNLKLCELKVPLACEQHWWGLETGCTQRCRCQDDVSCDDRTGKCPEGKDLPTQPSTMLTTQPSTTPEPMQPSTSEELTTQPSAAATSEPKQPLVTSAEPAMQPSTSTAPETAQSSTISVELTTQPSAEATSETMQSLVTSAESTMLPSTSSTPKPSTSAELLPDSTSPEPTQTSWMPSSPKLSSSSLSTTSLSASTLSPSFTALESTQLLATSTSPVSSSSSLRGLYTMTPRHEHADLSGSDGGTDEDGRSTTIIVVVAAFLVVAVLVVLLVAAFRRYKKHKSGSEMLVAGDPENNITGNGMEMALEPFTVTKDPIPVDAFRDHICRMVKLNGFATEFKALPDGLQKEMTAANAVNAGTVRKNRFKDISPFDETRVSLPKEEGKDCDYINASYIDGFNQKMAYIAAQGPLEQTVEDFWRMVWADSCGKIVMLTNLYEQDNKKCEIYWPRYENRSLTVGKFTITLVSAVEKDHFTHRVLDITRTADQGGENEMPRQIHQFQFTVWPDHWVACPVTLLHFWYQVVQQPSQLTGPTLVHCSAGVGRTGTFIALDMLIQQAKLTGKVSVYPTVTLLRNQRVKMVQTLNQYRFLHEAVKEWIVSRDTTVVKDDLTGSSQWTGPGAREKVAAQFEMLDQLRPSPDEQNMDAAKKEENQHKNRFSAILPGTQNRVCLWTPDDTISDYINAVFVSSVASQQRFIITQFPLKATVEDFFRMIIDWKVTTIVRFMDTPEDEGLSVYPDEGEQAEHGRISVHTLSKQVIHPGISLCTMHVSKATKLQYDKKKRRDEAGDKGDEEMADEKENADEADEEEDEEEEEDVDVSVYCVESPGILTLKDPGDAVALTNMLVSISKTVPSPLIFQCFNGASLSCVLCGVLMVREAMQVDGSVSPFLCARLIQSARPQAFKTLEEYEFVVRCLLHGANGTSGSEVSAYTTQNSSNTLPANGAADVAQNDSKSPPANGAADVAQNDSKSPPANRAADVAQNEEHKS